MLFAVCRAGSRYSEHSEHDPAAVQRTQRASTVERELFHRCFYTDEPVDKYNLFYVNYNSGIHKIIVT